MTGTHEAGFVGVERWRPGRASSAGLAAGLVMHFWNSLAVEVACCGVSAASAMGSLRNQLSLTLLSIEGDVVEPSPEALMGSVVELKLKRRPRLPELSGRFAVSLTMLAESSTKPARAAPSAMPGGDSTTARRPVGPHRLQPLATGARPGAASCRGHENALFCRLPRPRQDTGKSASVDLGNSYRRRSSERTGTKARMGRSSAQKLQRMRR